MSVRTGVLDVSQMAQSASPLADAGQASGNSPDQVSAASTGAVCNASPAASQMGARTEKDLIRATAPFAQEQRARSWMHTLVSLLAFAAALSTAVMAPWWPVRLAAAVVQGLLIVRLFILYHDYQHGSILRGSKIAKGILSTYGILSLNPPQVWRQTHNYHHAHNAKIIGSHVGSYAMLTTEMWAKLPSRVRLAYKLQRHPLTILLGYATVFFFGMCVSSFLRNPRKNWDSGLAIVVHLGLLISVTVFAGFDVALFGILVPQAVASAMGAYLFYAQHNFPGMHLQPREDWSYARAALESSSFMRLGPVMNWFTGNIGYHHVHHLNPKIPFYRLPEAMAALPELQHPKVTSLRPRDVWACLRLKLWDPARGEMVGYPKQ